MTDDSWRRIRPLALGVAPRGSELLVAELEDPSTGGTFYRPPGGGMAFGEPSEETLAREFDEELGVTIADHELLTTLERTFTFAGREGHEIWFLYRVSFVEDWPYERDAFTGEEDGGEPFQLVWKDRSKLAEETVFPDHLPRLVGGAE